MEVGLTRRILVIAAACAATLFVIEPYRALVFNWNEYSLGWFDLAARAWPPALVALTAIAFLGWPVYRAFGVRAVAVLLSFYVLLGLQTCVFVWSYGVFDGRPIDWSQNATLGMLEIAAAVAVVGAALLFADAFVRRSFAIAAFVFALQVSTLAATVWEAAPFAAREAPAQVDAGAQLTHWAPEGNALVIVLDSLQSDFFGLALEDESFAASVPEGFTYFRDAVAMYRTTQFSLQSILTGEAVPEGVDHRRWMAEAMARSLPARLGESGFDAALLSFTRGNLPLCESLGAPFSCMHSSEVQALSQAARLDIEASEIFRVGFFRAAPHYLKREMRSGGDWSYEWNAGLAPSSETLGAADERMGRKTRDDLAILSRLQRDIQVDTEARPRFLFLHLFGPHGPVSVDEQCLPLPRWPRGEVPGEGDERGRVVAATRCLLSKVFRVFETLKAESLYDSTTIAIVSDHGYTDLPVLAGRARPALPEPSDAPVALEETSGGLAFFLFKEPGARGRLRVSDRPVSLCDVPASVVDALGGDASALPCEPVSGGAERQQPRRHYRHLDYVDQLRLPPAERTRLSFEAYEVNGHSWHPNAWQPAPR